MTRNFQDDGMVVFFHIKAAKFRKIFGKPTAKVKEGWSTFDHQMVELIFVPREKNFASIQIYNLGLWLFTPPQTRTCPVKREPFQKDMSSSNHQFSRDMFVFQRVIMFKKK